MIGLLGGTFDPVHFGHLRPAIELLEALSLTEVRLVPGRLPPHRPQPRLTPARRRQLLQLAVQDVPGVIVDGRELDRIGPSYTIDTLRAIRAEVGPSEPICFALGSDAFCHLMSWYQWTSLTQYAHLVILTRAGHGGGMPAALTDWVARYSVQSASALRAEPAGRVYRQPVARLEISATSIRQLFAQGRSARGLMPDVVWNELAGSGEYGYPQVST